MPTTDFTKRFRAALFAMSALLDETGVKLQMTDEQAEQFSQRLRRTMNELASLLQEVEVTLVLEDDEK